MYHRLAHILLSRAAAGPSPTPPTSSSDSGKLSQDSKNLPERETVQINFLAVSVNFATVENIKSHIKPNRANKSVKSFGNMPH